MEDNLESGSNKCVNITSVTPALRRSRTGTLTTFNIHIWHFKGTDSYHAMHEVFFSTNVLYLVTWKLYSHQSSKHDLRYSFNNDVQYWIDLIQARAPGATVLIVGTHADELSKVQLDEALNVAKLQLEHNSQERLQILKNRIEKEGDEGNRLLKKIKSEQTANYEIIPVSCLDSLSLTLDQPSTPIRSVTDNSNRYFPTTPVPSSTIRRNLSSPKSTPIHTPIHSNNESVKKVNNFDHNMIHLRDRIIQIVKGTSDNPNPLGIGVVTDFCEKIRSFLNTMKETLEYCLFEKILEKGVEITPTKNDPYESDVMRSKVRDALTHLTSIGEVISVYYIADVDCS